MTDTEQGDVEKVALALKEADETFGYNMTLVRLVEGESTYRLTIMGAESSQYSSTDECYEQVAKAKASHSAKAVIAALSPAPLQGDQLAKLRAALVEGRQRLAQAVGIVVEFGDLNGFRNLSDQELGAAVIQMAISGAKTLDRIDEALTATGEE